MVGVSEATCPHASFRSISASPPFVLLRRQVPAGKIPQLLDLLSNKLAWIHDALRIKRRVELTHGCETQCSFFSKQIALVISPNAMLMTDGPMLCYDSSTGNFFENLPPVQRFSRVGGDAVEIVGIDA